MPYNHKKLFIIFPCLIYLLFSNIYAQTNDSLYITFRYNDNNGSIIRAFLTGGFNNWGPNIDGRIGIGTPSQMFYDKSSEYWIKRLKLRTGETYAYKFHFHLNQSGNRWQWIPDPLNPVMDGSDDFNSKVTITDPIIFEPTLKKDSTGKVIRITAGLFSSTSVSEVRLIVDDDIIDLIPFFDTYTGILDYTFPQGISDTASLQIVAIDSLNRLVRFQYPSYKKRQRKIDVTFLFHANQNLVPAGKVANLACFVGLLETLREHPLLKFQLHFSGTLLHDLLWFDTTAIHLIREGLESGQFEIFGSTYAQNIMYSTRIDTADFEFNDHQIKIHKDLIQDIFGVTPQAFWNCERVWTQNFVQLLADNGYYYIQVEGYILNRSGTTMSEHVVRTTQYTDRELVVFNDNQGFLGLVDHAVDHGDIYAVVNYLHQRYDEDVNDQFVIGYYQDAEATGLWDYESGEDPESNWNNLDNLLTVLENDPLIKVTTYEEFIQNNLPAEDLTPIVDGAATWMGRDAWFVENQHPNFEAMRQIYDRIRSRLDSVAIMIHLFPGDTTSASKLLQHAWFSLVAHQFEFAVHGYTGGIYHAQWQLARTAYVSALAAELALNPVDSIYMRDINQDSVEEVILADTTDLYVFSPHGGRLLYWFDLVKGEELVGNENFMVDYIEPYINDVRYIPVVRGGIDTYPWLWGNPIFPQVFDWEFTVRRRAFNDWVSVSPIPPQELANEIYQVSIDTNSITFSYSFLNVDIKKCFIPTSDGLNITYRLLSLAPSDLDIGIQIESGFCPSYLKVMDNGLSSLSYWDGSNTSQSVSPSTIGILNNTTGSMIFYDFETTPEYLTGEEDVFGLELNPTYNISLAAEDSTNISISIHKSEVEGTEEPQDEQPELLPCILWQNYPNPVSHSTTIKFSIPYTSDVELTIYNIIGREVAKIVSTELPPGIYCKNWEASDMASGVYFCRLEAGSFTDTKKLLVLK